MEGLQTDDTVISLSNITKNYQMAQHSFCALDNINLIIKRNEYVAITGPSGSGKSTLMNVLGCLDNPSCGQYLLERNDVASQSEAQLAKIRNVGVGFIFQSFNLLPKASVLINVMQPLVYRVMPNAKRKQMALKALERVGLSDKVDNLPNQLSGGQRQRVAIARALVTNPAIILGDEPTGNLDSKTTADIMALFDQLHSQGHTIILVTHEAEIAQHCHRVIRLVDGKIDSDVMNNKEVAYA